MPEIKNNFLRGRMNKDHDERLVGKGEYRDAMNVQVSSSDGSDVGSVQNVIGNRPIGVEFWNNELGGITGGYKCVGSIGSEKNNKFYYFLAKETFLWENSFEINASNNAINWELESSSGAVGVADPWDINTAPPGSASTSTVTDEYGYMTYTPPIFNEVSHPAEGNTYTITYDVLADPLSAAGQLILANAGTSSSSSSSGNVSLISTGDGIVAPGTYKTSWVQGPNNVGQIRLWHGNAGFIKIANIKVEESAASFIVEYDTEKDNITSSPGDLTQQAVTPVFVDLNGGVLKFNANKQITAINIVDDLLFWTDNNSEPKKINIPRCIEGTASDGKSNTTFVSNTQNTVIVEESHISVIKQAPKNAPLVYKERFRHKDKQYSADMVISSGDAHYTDLINSSKGVIHDFSFLSAGDTFRTNLISHANSVAPVVLEWSPGDEVVLKEYSTGTLYNTVEYRIKATITNWSGNTFETSNYIINSNRALTKGSQGTASLWGGAGFLTN